MRRWLFPVALALLAAGCGHKDDRTRLVVQRFFGACQAEYGHVADPGKAEGECGIITAMINQFEAANPGLRVVENTVFWPGYDQLTAQLAANGAPDLVTMHSSAIPDYEARGLLEPLDDLLAAVGIHPDQFTEAARAGVTVDGRIMGLPIDVWAPLWHVNMNLFRQAGLVQDGKPVLPTSTAEFHAHAAQFRERTGKPYFIQVTSKDFAGPMRLFYAWMMQQGVLPFRDAHHANFDSPEARRALETQQTLAYNALVAELEAIDPRFDEESEEYDESLVERVDDLTQGFEARGMPPADALRKALRYILGKDPFKESRRLARDLRRRAEEEEEARKKRLPPRKTDVKRNLDAKRKQPPDEPDARKEQPSRIDPRRLSDEDFDKLPKSKLRELRGDFF